MTQFDLQQLDKERTIIIEIACALIAENGLNKEFHSRLMEAKRKLNTETIDLGNSEIHGRNA